MSANTPTAPSPDSLRNRMAQWRPLAAQTYAALAVSLTCGQGMSAVCIGSIMIHQIQNQQRPDSFYGNFLVEDSGGGSLTALASLYFAGVVAGSLGASWLGHKFGARRVSLASTTIAAAAWSLLATAPSLTVALTARILLGIYFGTAFPSNNLFISGTAAPERRGMLSYSLEVANVVFGVLSFSLAGQLHWRQLALLLGVGTSFVTWAALVWLPDDPVWLVARNRPIDAQHSLAFYRGDGNDLWLLKRPGRDSHPCVATNDSYHHQQRGCSGVLRRWQMKPLLLCAIQVVMYVCSGGAVLQYYTAVFISNMVRPGDDSSDGVVGVYTLSVLLTITRVPAAVLSACVVDKCGRRQILQLSSLGMAISHALLLLHSLSRLQSSSGDTGGLQKLLASQWLAATALISWMAAFTFGNGPLTWTLVGELVPTRARHVLASMLVVLWAAITLLHVQTYPALTAAIQQHGVFAAWTLISLAHIVFVRLWLPETRGLTNWQVDKLFEPKSVASITSEAGGQTDNTAAV